MNDNVIHLLPAKEEAILRCYVTGSRQPVSFRKLYDAFISTHPDVDGRVHRALFWTSRFAPSSSVKISRQAERVR
jgi:hypothetical protein